MPRPSSKLVAMIGGPCAIALCVAVPQFEGMLLRGYEDPIGVVTVCAGHTKTAALGHAYSPEQCEAILNEDLIEHAEGVLKCAPTLEGHTGPLAASVSFAFNVGVGAFCRSTMARKLNAGDIAGACAELDRWVFAGGRKLNGLVKRRAIERDMCEGKWSLSS